MIHRRALITGLISLVAAPAIVRVASLMPVKVMVEPEWCDGPIVLRLSIPAGFSGISKPKMCWRNIVTGEIEWH